MCLQAGKNIVKDESSTVGNLLVMFTCPLPVLPNSLLFEVTLYVSLKYKIFLNKDPGSGSSILILDLDP